MNLISPVHRNPVPLSVLAVFCILAVLAACPSPVNNSSSASGPPDTTQPAGTQPPGSAKEITAFSVTIGGKEAAGAINQGNRTVTISVPHGTDVTGLIPGITHTGAGIEPPSGTAQNFTDPVTYTVTAADTTTAAWTVTVTFVIDSADVVEDILDSASGGGSSADPVVLPVALDLGDNGWADLLSAIDDADKYVALDLSASTMSGTEFDPGTVAAGARLIVSLILPDAVESIKAGTSSDPTFQNFDALESVNGKNVTTIGQNAFSNCDSLISVDLPAATSIGSSAFYNCDSLISVDLPAATSIGSSAFSNCDSLTSVDLPAATSIGSSAFWKCDSLTSVSLPVAISIGANAFSYSTSLTSVSLPVVISIGANAFRTCSLESVELPACLTSIGSNPFTRCTKLTSIIVDGSNPAYKHSDDHRMLLDKAGTALIAYPSAAGTVSLPGITSIGAYAFYNTSLTSVSLPAATNIGGYAFYLCNSLLSVDFPAAVSIGEYAFGQCTSLASVSLPAATSIGGYAFSMLNSLTSVSLGSMAPIVGTSLFDNNNSARTVTVTVPSGATGYGSAPTDSTTENWGNAFRGKGWDGTNYLTGTVKTNITLQIVNAAP
jgi:hypothetical protein